MANQSKPNPRSSTKKRPVAVTAALIGAGAAVVVAIIGLGGQLSSRETIAMPGVGVINSTKELNALITARCLLIDEFLKNLQSRSELNDTEKRRIAEIREDVRIKHEYHAAALRDGNAVLAHERLATLKAALADVDQYLSQLRAKYPELGPSLKQEQRELLDQGVAKTVSYEVEKEEGWLERARRALGW